MQIILYLFIKTSNTNIKTSLVKLSILYDTKCLYDLLTEKINLFVHLFS